MGEKNRLLDPQVVDHQNVIQKLVTESSPRKTFLALMFLSSVVATLGLLNQNTPIVIGAMLIAPLLWPMLALSMGVLVGDVQMLKLSFLSILFSVVLSVVTAMVITFFYVPLGASTLEGILGQSSYVFMIPVAAAAGAAAAFALVYENIGEAVTGVAISVALLPPLVTIGIGLGALDWRLMRDASELFLINLFSIVAVSFVIFALLGFRRHKRSVESAVKKEEKLLKRD